ncbi:MAG: hypothetical protein WCK31_02420 [bacterium]
MNKSTKILTGFVGSLALLFVPVSVNAQSLIPTFLDPLVKAGSSLGTEPGTSTVTLLSSILTIVFIVVFLVAIVYTFMAAIKYIRSEGNEQKVEEAKNAVKAVLFGVGAMFVAILGVVLISAFFGVTDPTNTTGLTGAINDIKKLLAPL